MSDRFISVAVASGVMEAEIIKTYLQSQGIKCVLSQEAVGRVYGFGVGPLAEVEIRVPSQQGKAARAALKAYYRSTRKSTKTE